MKSYKIQLQTKVLLTSKLTKKPQDTLENAFILAVQMILFEEKCHVDTVKSRVEQNYTNPTSI